MRFNRAALLAIALQPLCLPPTSAAWAPDSPLTHEVELSHGRWTIEAPPDLTVRSARSDAAIAIESDDRSFGAVLREVFLRDDSDGGGPAVLARRRCDAPAEEERLGPHHAWTVRCFGDQDPDADLQIDRWWYLAHPDGLVLQVGAHGADELHVRLMRRMLATLEPREVAPTWGETSAAGLRIEAPPGYAAWWGTGVDWHVLHVAQIVEARARRAELTVGPGPPPMLDRPLGATPWEVGGWRGLRWPGEQGVEARADIRVRCGDGASFDLVALLVAPDSDRVAELERALSSVELTSEPGECRLVAPMATPQRVRRWSLALAIVVAVLVMLGWAAREDW